MEIASISLDRFEKAGILNRDSDRVYLPEDFEDDPPLFHVTLEGKIERHAGLLGILAFDQLQPGLDLYRRLGITYLELARGIGKTSQARFSTGNPFDQQLVSAIHWSGINTPAVAAEVFAQETAKREIIDVFEAVTNGQYRDLIPTLEELAQELEAGGVIPPLSE